MISLVICLLGRGGFLIPSEDLLLHNILLKLFCEKKEIQKLRENALAKYLV